MNSTPHDPSRLAAPDMYEIELTETQRLTDGNFTNNGTLTLQGEHWKDFHFRQLVMSIFRKHRKQPRCSEAGRSFNCDFRTDFVDGRNWTFRSSLGQNQKLRALCAKIRGGTSKRLMPRSAEQADVDVE